MKIDLENDELIFSSGRREYANCCIVGLGPDLHVTEGYDGGLYSPDWQGETLTPAEQIELADYMIEQWGLFKVKAQEAK